MPILCYTSTMRRKYTTQPSTLYPLFLVLSLLTPLFILSLFTLSLSNGSKDFLLLTPIYALDIGSAYPFAMAIGNRTLGEYITPIITFSILAAGVIAFLIFLVGGVTVIAGAGNPKQTESGKNAITAGVIGFVLVVTAYWIIQIIEVITGLNLLEPGI